MVGVPSMVLVFFCVGRRHSKVSLNGQSGFKKYLAFLVQFVFAFFIRKLSKFYYMCLIFIFKAVYYLTSQSLLR